MRPSEASQIVDQLLARAVRAPLDASAAADLADAALTCEREGEAIAPVRIAARRYGGAALWQWLGLLHRALEQHAAALEAYDHAMRAEPANARAVHGRARVVLEAGLPASELFERAHALAPLDGDVLLGRAAARLAEGECERALTELDALLTANPGWLPGHETAAQLRSLCGERDMATIALERALRIAPRDPALWRTLLALLVRAELHADALEVVQRGRAAIGQQRLFDEHEALLASELGDVRRADALFAGLAPAGDAAFAIRHVRHLLRTGRVREAAALAEQLTARRDGDAAWPYAAVAWRLLGDPRWEWLEGDPRLIGVYDIRAALPPLEVLAERLRALHVARDRNLGQSVRGGTQTDGPLFSRVEPEIRQLRAAVVQAVDAHIAQLPSPDPRHPTLRHRRDRPVRFSGSWSVRLRGAGHHANHLHPAGWLSSALHVALPGIAERGPAPAGWLAFGEPPVELGLDLAPTRLIEPQPGTVVLFPSTMWHGTRPIVSGERLSVAFDVATPVVLTA